MGQVCNGSAVRSILVSSPACISYCLLCSCGLEQQECTNNVQFCNKNEQPELAPINTSKVFTVAANGEITPPQTPEKSNKEDVTQNVTFATPEDTRNAFCQSSNFQNSDLMALPPHMRPSPFIDGNTVWITHPDHLESHYDTYGNKWGPMKMSYTIRYYPDIDPARAA